MKKQIQAQSPQTSFNFDAIMAAPQQDNTLQLAAMNYFADRLHNKIDLMRERGMLDSTVSLTIKADDKALMEAAHQTNDNSLSTAQNIALSKLSTLVVNAKDKIFVDYEDVEQLFGALH